MSSSLDVFWSGAPVMAIPTLEITDRPHCGLCNTICDYIEHSQTFYCSGCKAYRVNPRFVMEETWRYRCGSCNRFASPKSLRCRCGTENTFPPTPEKEEKIA